ncbi:MAG TPA: cyclic nucleotide-binding domain-containing protein [Burkholderiales bacterium]
MADFFERILILKSTSIFSEVNTDDLRVVVEEMQEEAYFPGEHVFEINDPSDRMYIVLTGKVGISIHRDPRVRDFVTELGPGECFGEMGPIDGSPRSGTAHVLEDSLLLYLDKLKLHGLIASYPELSLGLLRGMSMRVRQTSAKLISALNGAAARNE